MLTVKYSVNLCLINLTEVKFSNCWRPKNEKEEVSFIRAWRKMEVMMIVRWLLMGCKIAFWPVCFVSFALHTTCLPAGISQVWLVNTTQNANISHDGSDTKILLGNSALVCWYLFVSTCKGTGTLSFYAGTLNQEPQSHPKSNQTAFVA